MTWEFEHWDNGKVYLHHERWEAFRKNIEKYGYNGQQHDWNHQRIFCCLHTPRENLLDIPAPGDDDLKYKIEFTQEWRTIYDPFPAFVRTNEDPEGWLPSWNLWSEDTGDGEQLGLLYTGHIRHVDSSRLMIVLGSSHIDRNIFASYQGKFWRVDGLHAYGVGHHPPPVPKKKKVLQPRSIFDPFEESW